MKQMALDQIYTLSNSVTIPKLGLGTWMIEDHLAAKTVKDAVEIGYRHFDSAQGYSNESGIGEGVRSCGLTRSELFVTSKLQADYKTYAEAKKAIDGSLVAMGIEYIDLMLIHSPQPWMEFRNGEHFFEGNLEAWCALEDAYSAGKLRAIGVSNFEAVDLDNLLTHGTVKPMVNQVLAHISNTPFDVIEYSQSKGILVEAYSPIAHGAILNNPVLVTMAQTYGVTVPQLCIRYCLQLGMLPLPKTANPIHMRSNANIDFEISKTDMEILKKAERIQNYGDASIFPVFGGMLQADGTCVARD